MVRSDQFASRFLGLRLSDGARRQLGDGGRVGSSEPPRSRSDSHTQPELARIARRKGLDFIGSAEHNTSAAILTWAKYVEQGDQLLATSDEDVNTRNGHWLAMGLPAGT
jgi:hypothetical protein